MGKLNDLLTMIIAKVNASVKTEAQSLSDEEKEQARTNIGAGEPQVQADWNQSDESQPDFVKNKLAYTETASEVILSDTEVELDGALTAPAGGLTLELGKTYLVKIDGITYEAIASEGISNGIVATYIGDPAVVGLSDASNGLPFVIGSMIQNGSLVNAIMCFEPEGYPESMVPMTGKHTICITKIETIAHKIDPALVPVVQLDYEQHSCFAADFIKNKPFYEGLVEVRVADAIASGALKISVGASGYDAVKVAEYVPAGDWMSDIRITIADEGNTYVRARFNVGGDEGGWSIGDVDMGYAFGCQCNSEILGLGIDEPGIYVLYPLVTQISLPVHKKLDSSMMSVRWDDINEKPFGRIERESIVNDLFDDPYADVIIKSIIETGEQIAEFKKFWDKQVSVEDIIGATLTLSDNSTITVTSDIVALVGGGWEIENLLLCGGWEWSYDDANTVGYYDARSNGLFTSNATGVYVTEIEFPDIVKSIEPELIPRTTPNIQKAELGQAIVVKAVDENGAPTEWKSVSLPEAINGEDGISASHSWDGTILTIVSASGTSSADLKGEKGDMPKKGIDYFTEADKTEIVNAVLAALPTYEGGSY